MFLVLLPEQFNKDNILFSKKQKNNILDNGAFYRLYYSPEELTMNGLFIKITFKNIQIEQYFNRMKCHFDKNKNNEIINFIVELEKCILTKINIKKNKIYRINEQISQGCVKIFVEKEPYHKNLNRNSMNNTKTNDTNVKNKELILKISGIWEDEYNYGLTFRFLTICNK